MDEDLRSALYVSAGVLLVAFFNLSDEASEVTYTLFHSPLLVSASVLVALVVGANFLDPADDLAIGASVGLFDANYQRQWLHSPETQDPSKPLGQKYGWPADSQHHRAEDSYASRGEVNVCFGSLADISERIRYVRFGS